MAAIHVLGQQYGFKIIEDASHAIGGRYLDEPIGNCKFSDITVFSFHPVKIITTGEGGMATTNNAGLASKMRLLRSHGITREANQMTRESDGPWYYQQIELGFNYRMTDMQAALGLSQMQRLDTFVEQRHEISSRYDVLLADLPVITPWQHQDGYSALHLYVIRLKLVEINQTHKEVFSALRAHGIGVNLHYIPIYQQPYFEQFGYQTNQYPEAEQYYAEAISLPMFTGLTQVQQKYVIDTLRQVLLN